MKANFIRLKQAVFCVGSGKPYDGGIEPWQTGHGEVMIHLDTWLI